MRVKFGKQKLGQYVNLPRHCSKCVFEHNSLKFCVAGIKYMLFGYFSNCTSEDIFKL